MFTLDVVIDVYVVLTSVHPAVDYAFGATLGAARRRPPETPHAFGGSRAAPVETTKVAVVHRCFFAEHGPLPLVISSQRRLLVAHRVRRRRKPHTRRSVR